MATQNTGGYDLDLSTELEEMFSARLEIYIDGMMAFAYDRYTITNEQEIAVLESVVDDLNVLIEKKRNA